MSSRLLAPFLLLALTAVGTPVQAQPEPTPREQHVLTLEQSVVWALQNNPELAVFRRQRGIAEAGVVIARTYPFNPIWSSAVMGVGGPASAGITNRIFNQHTLGQEVEWRGQGKIRRDLAAAALSRVEWEIATQEQQMAVRTIRAFNAFVYWREKLRLLDETIQLQEQTVAKVKLLVDQGKLKTADLMLARSDEAEARGQRGSRQNQAVTAWHDLRRLLGVRQEILEVDGRLTTATPEGSTDQWTHAALQKRADLQAANLVCLEAQQREHLEIVNRFGNPTIGVKTEYNETGATFVGATLQFPLPIYNTRRGEILQRQAEKTKAMTDKNRIELQICQDVLAARDHLQQADKWARSAMDTLRLLQKTMAGFDQLFAKGDPSVDVLRLIDVRRRHLRSRDGYLDALWELNQARAELAAAVGDFTLAIAEPVEAPVAAIPVLGPPQEGDPR